MTCSACTGAVEATLGGLTGVSSAAVSLLTNTAEVLLACTLSVALCTATCCALLVHGSQAVPPARGLVALANAPACAACFFTKRLVHRR